MGKKVAIVHGPVGVGKTETVRYVAQKLGYTVVVPEKEWGFSRIYSAVRTVSMFGKELLLLDRPYRELGLKGRELAKIIRETKKPIVIETENPKPYEWTAGAVIKIEPPPKTKIAALIKDQALTKPNFRLVKNDIRQAMFLGYGTETYTTRDWIKDLETCLKNGQCGDVDSTHLPVILDTLVANCYGIECLEGIKILVAADLSRRPEKVLRGFRLKRYGRPVFYFYQRLKSSSISVPE